MLDKKSKIWKLTPPRAGGRVLGLPNDRGVPPINCRKAPFLGKKLEEKGPISRQIAGHLIHLGTNIAVLTQN